MPEAFTKRVNELVSYRIVRRRIYPAQRGHCRPNQGRQAHIGQARGTTLNGGGVAFDSTRESSMTTAFVHDDGDEVR